jgi:predicted alpha/beta superfamily hydrolase
MQRTIVIALSCILLRLPPLYGQTTGRVEGHTFHSTALGVYKNYYVYLPAGYDSSAARYPVVFFLRLHEFEWFDGSKSGRNGRSLKDVADTLIDRGHIGKMILVGPSTGSDDSQVYASVNMLHPELTTRAGVGTGRFEDYLIQDLIPHIDSTFRTIPDRGHRGIDGFSLGGFASTILGIRHPEEFCSVGSYDDSIMWYNLVNFSGAPDPLWFSTGYDQLFGPLFGVPRDSTYMMDYSVTNVLMAADAAKLDRIRSLRFHLKSVYSNDVGNLFRNRQFVDSLAAKGILNSFPDLILSPLADHTFKYADLHASMSLVKHWETFQQPVALVSDHNALPASAQLYQNFPNPFNPLTNIPYSLSQAAFVTLTVYNTLGQQVARLVNEEQQAGYHDVEFRGERMASGVYFYRLQARDFVASRKLLLLK